MSVHLPRLDTFFPLMPDGSSILARDSISRIPIRRSVCSGENEGLKAHTSAHRDAAIDSRKISSRRYAKPAKPDDG